jgi:hypothetical protein
MMLAPGPTPATREAAIAAEVEAIQHELRRVDARLRALSWGAPSPRRLSVADEWALTAGTIEPVRQEDDGVARAVLYGKRDALLQRLGELRARLTGEPGVPRRGRWG